MDMSECPTSTPDRHLASFQEAGHQKMHATAAKDSLLGMDMLSQKGTLLLDTVQITAAATRLGCRGSTGPSHRKWVMKLRCVCVLTLSAFVETTSVCTGGGYIGSHSSQH